MDRRRAAGLLLALAACIATATAAPTASNHTALDLYDAAPDGCYYNFQHYGEGDRIMTNEPCLNCTCHNRMLMCYLRVCPFTKPIGQDCTIEKRADQCCPIVTCPDVPVDLLTSTTTSPAEYGPTGIGKLDKFGCSINGKYFQEGSKVPPTPNKPCEHCYCIRNMTTCVMQECTLHVDGCTPIYHKDVCCPVRYSCDHPEDEMPLLDDLSTTVRPTPGFLLTTTTISPVTQISQDCIYDNRVFPDGALIKTEKACDHCYCMKGDIVCVVQECGTPMENEGKNCTALPPREGVCCPDTYICDGDESTTGTYEAYDFTTQTIQEKVTTLSPPRRTSSEGSGYRNEPDEVLYTKLPIFEPDIEGSGEEEEPKQSAEVIPGSPTTESTDDILASTEEIHEYIPLTTTKPTEEESPITEVVKEDERVVSSGDTDNASEPQELPSTTGPSSIKEIEEPVTDKAQVEDIGSGDEPEDVSLKPNEKVPATLGLPVTEEILATTEINVQDILTLGVTERESSESQIPITSVPISVEEKIKEPIEQDIVTSDVIEKTTPKLPIEHAITSIPALEESTETAKSTEQSQIHEESSTKGSQTHTFTTTITPIIENIDESTESVEQNSVPNQYNKVDSLEPQHYPPSSPSIDDDFVTTESQEHEIATEFMKGTEYLKPQHHVTASTPMLEEIEKDTTEYTELEHIVPSVATQDDTFDNLSTTISNILSGQKDEKDIIESTTAAEHISGEDYIPGTTNIPVYDQQEISTGDPHEVPDIPIETDVKESSKPEQYAPSTGISTIDESGRRTTQPDLVTTTASALENEGGTTEPDKGLNTIPSDTIEEEVQVTQKDQITTLAEDNITTESDLDTTVKPNADFIAISSKQTTISDSSVSREEPSAFTTESTFRKEDYSTTKSQVSPESTTVTAGVTKEVISTHDLTENTESISDLQEISTTLKPKYTENIEETTLAKKSTGIPSYDSTSDVTLSEKDVSLVEGTITSTTPYEKIPETTTANHEDNEIFNEPRIPGEGDCLLNGVTYTNESAVPSTNKCQSGCKCVSSIIKCDPIICSLPPEYMNNCEAIYDSPDSCCPTYICDHKTETMPPQSHSQMSGTESPVISTVQCHGDECEISEDKKDSEEPSEACKFGNCGIPSDKSKETSVHSSSENIPEQPIIDKKEGCIGDKCPVYPVKPCETEKCEITPELIASQESQQCANGKDCAIPNIPTKECSTGNCGSTNTQSEETYPKEVCTDKEGCQPDVSDKECKGDDCRKIDSSPLDQHVPEQCKEPGCNQTQEDLETSTASNLEQTIQEDLGGSDKKQASVKVTETTEKLEITTEASQYTQSHETSGLPEEQEIVTKQPEIVSDDYLTTLSDKIELVTKFELETEATIKLTELKKPESTEETEYLLPVSTESTIKENKTKLPSMDEIGTEMPDIFTTPKEPINTDEHVTKTERPQEIITQGTTEPDITLSVGMSTKISEVSYTEPSTEYTSKTQEVTESAEKLKPEDATKVFPEEGFTEPPISYTPQSNKITTPSEGIKHTTEEITEESGTIHPTIHVTESQEVTGSPDKITQKEEITQKIQEENITEPPNSLDKIKHDDQFTKEVLEASTTESTETLDSEEQVGEKDHAVTASKPLEDPGTATPTLPVDLQKVTATIGNIELDSTTIRIIDEISEPPKSISTDLQDVIQPSQETEHKDTSIIVEETDTEPSNTYITDLPEILKPSEKLDHEITTANILDEPSTESPKSSQDLNREDSSTQVTEVSDTIPPKTYFTESQIITKSPEEIEQEGTEKVTFEEFSTQPPQTYEPTSQISEQPSTEPPKIYVTEEQEITKPFEKLDHKETITKTEEYFTEPPITFATEPQEVPESHEKVDQKDTTSKISEKPSTESPKLYSTEQQQIIKSSEEINHDETTQHVLEESATETTKTYESMTQVPKSSEEVEQEDSTSKISQTPITESPIYITGSQDVPKSPEEIESFGTTVKTIDESATELPQTLEEIEHRPQVNSEAPELYVTINDIESETLTPIIVEIPTEKSIKDENKPSLVSETLTTTQEQLTPESVKSTTPSFTVTITTSEDAKSEETTSEAPYNSESKPSQTDIDSITNPSVIEELSTTTVPSAHGIVVTVPVISGSEQTYTESTPEQRGTQKTGLEIQTTFSPSGISTQSPEKPTASEKTPELNDTEIQVPAFVPTDELRTTSSEVQDITTVKPKEYTQAPHDVEIEMEYPDKIYTKQEEQRTETLPTVSEETSTEEISAGTEKPLHILEEEMKTETPVPVTEMDFTKGTESETGTSQISSDGKPLTKEENTTEKPVTKYSSPEPTIGYDSTKSYPDEYISTVEPIFHESKKPERPVDGLIQSLITEQYETSTKPSEYEKDSQTQIPIEVSSSIPESDITRSSEQEEKLTTPPKSSNITVGLDDKSVSVSSTEYAKPVEEEIHTELPSFVDKIASDTTTQKEYLPEEGATSQEPLAPETVTSTISEHKFTTERLDIPSIEISTETIKQDTSITDTQETDATDKPLLDMNKLPTESSYTTEASQESAATGTSSVDIHKLPTESSYTTEASVTRITIVEDQPTPGTDEKYAESEQAVTKVPDVQIQEPTEPSEAISEESPEMHSITDVTISGPVNKDRDMITVDQITTEGPEPTKKQPELTMLETSVETESPSAFESTTAPKHEYSESSSKPSTPAEYSDKPEDESAGEEFTTESGVTESNNAPQSPEVYTEKQSETIHTVTPKLESLDEIYLATKKPLELEVYETTSPAIEDISEKSTRLPVSSEEISTTTAYDISPAVDTSQAEEQSIPVVIPEINKISTPEESIVEQTERVTLASEKPIQETTAPEEEFILASKVTTAKAEEKISTLSPIDDRTTERLTDKPDEPPVTTAPEEPITTGSEAPITTSSEELDTIAPKVPVTTAPEAPVTTAPEAPVTTASEAIITAVPATAITVAFETDVTTAPETPIASVPKPAITAAPEAAVTTSPEAPITTAPEAVVTKVSEAPVTSATEIPKPVSTEVQPTDEVPIPDEEVSFPPSGGTSGYGQEPDYGEEDQSFGPGTCRYGGKVYVSAQQIPRDDPCDFCFCFRSDIICLQQSCPPPIHGCHEEPIQGFCCPRYECPVSMATTVNVTTTTTTTTTTLPPNFPTHSYKGSAQKRGCQIKGQTYKVGDVVRASSGPCLHCTCGGDGQMKCDPKVCTPEPMLRQMIAAAVSAKRRR